MIRWLLRRWWAVMACLLLLSLANRMFSGVNTLLEQRRVSAAYGTLRDDRDGKEYKTVVIGGKTWLAENLNYQTDYSWCHWNSDTNCVKYGRLYAWKAARKACPPGWHLPSYREWDSLALAVGGAPPNGDMDGSGSVHWSDAGKKLKARSGWGTYIANKRVKKKTGGSRGGAYWTDVATVKSGNGTDNYGFSALPGGERNFGGDFSAVGTDAKWWTASKYHKGDYRDLAYYRSMKHTTGDMNGFIEDVDDAYSVRCVLGENNDAEEQRKEDEELRRAEQAEAESAEQRKKRE